MITQVRQKKCKLFLKNFYFFGWENIPFKMISFDQKHIYFFSVKSFIKIILLNSGTRHKTLALFLKSDLLLIRSINRACTHVDMFLPCSSSSSSIYYYLHFNLNILIGFTVFNTLEIKKLFKTNQSPHQAVQHRNSEWRKC